MSAETQDRKSQCSGGQDDEQGGSSVGEDRMSRADESESDQDVASRRHRRYFLEDVA